MSAWDHRAFGTHADPIRQSALNAIASQNGCGARYRFERQAEAAGSPAPTRAHWRPVLGTAVHAVIERGITRTWAQLESIFGPGAERPADALPGWAPRALRDRADEVLREELRKATGVDASNAPLPLEWYDADPSVEIAAGVAMIVGAFRTIVERASEVIACEAPFHAELDGYALEGTIDILYRSREDGSLCLADWKTGERKLPQVLLDHGYQPAIYAHALEHGVLFPGVEGRELRLATPPASIHVVHLRDFVPYVKKPRTAGKNVGDMRGPGWYASHRTPTDVERLRVSIRTVVGTVRMGRFLEHLGEQCSRCPFRGPCLGATVPDPAQQRALQGALAGVDVGDGGLGEEAA